MQEDSFMIVVKKEEITGLPILYPIAWGLSFSTAINRAVGMRSLYSKQGESLLIIRHVATLDPDPAPGPAPSVGSTSIESLVQP